MISTDDAFERVRDIFDDDPLSDDELGELFLAIFGYMPTEDERLLEWIMIRTATPGRCDCDTRLEHTQGACAPRPQARITYLLLPEGRYKVRVLHPPHEGYSEIMLLDACPKRGWGQGQVVSVPSYDVWSVPCDSIWITT